MIIERPIITEKSLALATNGVYSFGVAASATSTEIRKAIASLYGVTVTDVRTLSIKGKEVRRKTGLGRQKDWKKALVTLKAGQKIKEFVIEEEKKSDKTDKVKSDEK